MIFKPGDIDGNRGLGRTTFMVESAIHDFIQHPETPHYIIALNKYQLKYIQKIIALDIDPMFLNMKNLLLLTKEQYIKTQGMSRGIVYTDHYIAEEELFKLQDDYYKLKKNFEELSKRFDKTKNL